MKHYSTLALTLVLVGPALFAADWPQWQGPTRDNVSKETGLLRSWPRGGPPLVWTSKDAGAGYSSLAVVDGRIYTLGARDGITYLLALDARNGKEVWKAKVGPVFSEKAINQWGGGPRSTPAVSDGLVYALGGFGDFVCVEAATGKEVWRKHMARDLGGEVNPIGGGPEKLGWGYAWSPLIDGENVICFPGGPKGAVAALNKKTGEVVWRSKKLKEQASYSSPIVAEVGGIRHYVVVLNQGVAGVAAKDGELLWFYKKRPKYPDVVIPTPLFHDGHVFVTAGYRPGSGDLLKLTAEDGKITAENVYGRRESRQMKSKVGSPVLVDRHVYCHFDRIGWACVDLRTGKIVWEEERALGPGSVIYADGHLYCYGEDDGTAVLAEASPAGWKEKGRFEIPQHAKKAVSGRHWTPPVIAHGRLYLRDQDLLFCYDIKAK